MVPLSRCSPRLGPLWVGSDPEPPPPPRDSSVASRVASETPGSEGESDTQSGVQGCVQVLPQVSGRSMHDKLSVSAVGFQGPQQTLTLPTPSSVSVLETHTPPSPRSRPPTLLLRGGKDGGRTVTKSFQEKVGHSLDESTPPSLSPSLSPSVLPPAGPPVNPPLRPLIPT